MGAERSVLVFGAGSVGGYLGGKLAAQPGLHVTLLGRAPLVEAVNERGLAVHEGAQEVRSHPAAITEPAAGAVFDLVLLTVRTFDVPGALPSLRPLLGKNAHVIALQNGVGSEEEVAEGLGRDRVIAGTLTIRTGMDAPGSVSRSSGSGGVALSAMNATPVPAWVVAAFQSTGLPVEQVADYRSLRWSKLLLNMLGAASSAILDIGVPELAADPRLFRIEQLAFREAGRVMDALGVKTIGLPGYPVPLGRLAMRLPRPLAQRLIGPRLAGARGGHSPGMRADLQRGRTEIDHFNGAVAATAVRLGLAAPVNTALTTLVRQLAETPALRAEFRGNTQRLLEYVRSHGARL